jgi:sulfate adenylyltransferase (ADP) / ATP adenylyltransferase
LPALSKKPTANDTKAEDAASKPKPDPFTNPSPDLLVKSLPPDASQPSHILVLNKYPVIAEHFILSTFENKPQSFKLDPDDLYEAFRCINQWKIDTGTELYAFYNSGEHSGASQPHRHLQLLPVEQMRDGIAADDNEWSVLANNSAVHASLPFKIEGTDAPGWPCDAAELSNRFLLLQMRCGAATGGANTFSYNFAMTSTKMVMCLRGRGDVPLCDENGKDLGMLSINGTILAGTLMTKSQEAYDLLRSSTGAFEEVLAAIGSQSAEYPKTSRFVKL